MSNELSQIKRQKWFYEFSLPDGTKTESYLPEVARQIHPTREKALRKYLEGSQGVFNDALDISCHEGYFSLVLTDYFPSVVGIDKNADSLQKTKQISKVMGRQNIGFSNSTLEDWPVQ